MKERSLIAVSSLVLAAALGVGGWMILRAKAQTDELAQRAALLQHRDGLRADIADLCARSRLTAVPREQAGLTPFRDIVQEVAAWCARDPLNGTPSEELFACVALDFAASPDDLEIWTSAPLHPDDQVWAVGKVMENLGTSIEGGGRAIDASRIKGAAWAAFRVDGQVRIAAIFWQSPRSR